MTTYKSYRDYYLECKKRKNVTEEKCPHCYEKILICKSYGGICKSDICKAIRWQHIYN